MKIVADFGKIVSLSKPAASMKKSPPLNSTAQSPRIFGYVLALYIFLHLYKRVEESMIAIATTNWLKFCIVHWSTSTRHVVRNQIAIL